MTVTSSEENDFVHYSVVNTSAITGWASFAGYKGTWIGGSDSGNAREYYYNLDLTGDGDISLVGQETLPVGWAA